MVGVAAHRGSIDGSEPIRIEPVARVVDLEEHRRATRTALLGTGTLACPACDAPVSPSRPLTPCEPLACPLCDHAGRVRDFLSLASPARPARVAVRVR